MAKSAENRTFRRNALTSGSCCFPAIRPLDEQLQVLQGSMGICFMGKGVNPSYTPTQYLGLHGQSYTLFIREPQLLSIELFLENTVLLYKIVDDRLLTSTKPAGQCD
jgi:hypothetical protein